MGAQKRMIRDREASLMREFNKDSVRYTETTHHFSSEAKEKKFISDQFRTRRQVQDYRRYRKEWHRRANSKDAGDVPLAVICELVSFCNLRCKMCYTRTPRFQKAIAGRQRIMPWELVTRIIDECADIGVFSMLFSWRGEPTLYRSKDKGGKWHDFADVLRYARDKGIPEITSLTNGRSLTDGLIKKIVKAQPNWLSFSVDGFGRTYDLIRESIVSETKGPPLKSSPAI